jgi:hypothetical protein
MKLDITDFLLKFLGIFNNFCINSTDVKEHFAQRFTYVFSRMSKRNFIEIYWNRVSRKVVCDKN